MMEAIAQVATAIGAAVGAGSLLAGFSIYRRTKRDEYAGSLRKAIADTRANSDVIKGLLSFEIVNEISSAVVYSRDLELITDQIFTRYFLEPAQDPEGQSLSLEDYLEVAFPVITVSIHTHSVQFAQEKIAEMSRSMAPFQSDHPGLYRIASSLESICAGFLREVKDTVRDEDIWKRLITNLRSGEIWSEAARNQMRKDLNSVEHLRSELHQVLVGLLLSGVKFTRETYSDIGEMLDIAADAYIGKTELELEKLARSVTSMDLVPMSRTEKVTEDLEQAEKALDPVLSKDDLLMFREIRTRIVQRTRNQ